MNIFRAFCLILGIILIDLGVLSPSFLHNRYDAWNIAAIILGIAHIIIFFLWKDNNNDNKDDENKKKIPIEDHLIDK